MTTSPPNGVNKAVKLKQNIKTLPCMTLFYTFLNIFAHRRIAARLPFSVTIWVVFVWWLDQGPSVQSFLWNIFFDFSFKIHPVDRIFFLQVERTFLVCHVQSTPALRTPRYKGHTDNTDSR